MATELAKAYIQIIPSAKGIQGSISKSLAGEADAAGTSAGSRLVGTIKKVIATAAIGKALAFTISQGAELEQSIGGIETLFKESANKVKENAANAYKTAGMSANEYMQLTTSFSASLLQSLSGDTAKAAEISNTAMTDMSDNANKMGTNMEDIKNAYQGFAKQNYTMLDNLKLGYGGTKTEMERLLADAQKVTGVKYDINNLADVYSAIHVIQGELDITGTTAKEAASTISGSFASMKSAFQNVLGQITLGMDVGPALSALADTVVTFLVGNLLPAVWNILSALPGALVTFVKALAPQLLAALTSLVSQIGNGLSTAPQLLVAAAQMIQQIIIGIAAEAPKILETATIIMEQLIGGIQANLPVLLQNGITILTNILNGVLQNLPQIITTAGTLITTLASGILGMLPTIQTAGTQMLLNLVNGIINNLPNVVTAAATTIAKFVASIGQNLPQILQTGIEMLGKLAAGLIKAIPNLIGKIPQIIKSIKQAFTEIDWGEIGRNIISGIANGLSNAGNQLWSAVKGVLGNFKDKVLEFFGIHSPSRWGMYVGNMITLGLAEGVEGNLNPVTKAVDEMQSIVTNPFGNDMAYKITGVATERKESVDNSILNRIDILVSLLEKLVGRSEETNIILNRRQLVRALREEGVVFQ